MAYMSLPKGRRKEEKGGFGSASSLSLSLPLSFFPYLPRYEDCIAVQALQLTEVLLALSRVRSEILMSGELSFVHVDGDDDYLGFLPQKKHLKNQAAPTIARIIALPIDHAARQILPYLFRSPYEREVSAVQAAHRRHEPDRAPGAGLCFGPSAHCGLVVGDEHRYGRSPLLPLRSRRAR